MAIHNKYYLIHRTFFKFTKIIIAHTNARPVLLPHRLYSSYVKNVKRQNSNWSYMTEGKILLRRLLLGRRVDVTILKCASIKSVFITTISWPSSNHPKMGVSYWNPPFNVGNVNFHASKSAVGICSEQVICNAYIVFNA